MTELEKEGLPQGWVETSFGDLNFYNSRNVDPADFPEEVFELYSVPNFPKGVPEIQPGEAIGSTKQTIQADDVLVCKINPRINRVWKVGSSSDYRQIGSSEWIIFRSPMLHADFLKHYFKSQNFRELLCADVTGVGGSLTRAQPSKVATFPVPLPPLPEQIRIADKLDALLSRVDAGRERLERVPKLVKQFRQAVLSAAVSGELTREWRGGGDAEWKRVTAGDCIESLRNGISLKPTEHPTGVPILKISSVRPFSVRTEAGRFVHISQNETNSFNLVRHDLLVTRYNGSLDLVGVAGMVRTPELEGFTYPDKLMRVRVNASVLPAFLELVINAPASRVVIEGAAKTTSGQTGISGKDLKELSLLRPPLPEQAEIVRRVEALFAIADRLEGRYRRALASFDRLTPALLARAFRGELVPQDPNDEPASVLLERIRAQRVEGGEKPRRGRQPGKAAQEGSEPKRLGRPSKAEAEGRVEVGELKRRGRPPKARPEAVIPEASSMEDAIRQLQERGQQRAEGTRQVSLFDEEG